MVSYDPPIPIPSRLPVLPLPYPLILHPSLLLSIPLTYAHSLSLLKAAIRVSDPSAADFGSGNAPGDAGDRKQRSVKGDTNPAFDGNRPIIVACVPTIRAPHGSNGGGKELVKRADKNGQNGGTGDAGAGPEDERVKVNDLHEWGVAARLLRLTRHPASQTCTLLVTGLTRVRIDRWLSVRAPLTSTALDRDRNLNVPDVPVPLAQTTAFLDSEPWPYAPEATAADIALVRTLKKAANELLDALAFPPPAVGPSGDAAAGTPPSPLPGTSIPLLPPALLKRLRSFVKDAKDNQAGLVADVVTGTLGGACEWADRIAVLADWDQQERTRNAGEALAKGAGRVKLARELLSTLTSPLNSSSREGLIRSQLEALLAQLAALNPNITARITTSSGSFGGGKNGDHNNGKVGGIITIRSPDASENNNNKGGIMPFSAPRGNSGGHSLSGRGGSGGGSGGNDEEEDEVAELARRLERTALSPEARKACERELKRLSRIPPQSVERGVLITYLEWMADLPWEKNSADLDPVADAHAPKAIGGAPKEAENDEGIVERARRILDEDHYGLEKIKRRLVEYLAVLELKSSQAAERAIAEEAAQPKAQIGLPTESAQSTTEGQEDGDIQHLEDAVVEENKRQADKKRRQTVPDKGPILLLVGPPGTGKTSIARSLATALRRPFTRLSLGGVRDEAEIRGHRRTYVGAMPGNIVSGLRKVGVNDPVVLLDEVDKLGSGNGLHGDPMAAMLEVLDPEQNHAFNDHYINVPIDLSRVLFIATANTLDTISPPLLDRTEVIHVSGYTHDEKVAIAKTYLLPKQIRAQGLTPDQLQVSDDVLLRVATSYTREAGVRTLEREIGAIARAKAVEYSSARKGEKDESGQKKVYDPAVRLEDVERILGIEKYEPEVAERDARPGVATGLAYQGSGSGGILHIESLLLPPGTGYLKLTGSLGHVIRESAELALSWVKAHAFQLGITPARDAEFPKNDVHLHLPSGAVPKDGPSAGIAMTCALVSLFTRSSLPTTLAMTGEITLRGQVTPVGGIREKLLGAHRAGITRVILPHRNRKDVESDVPANVRSELSITYVRTIWAALEAAFGNALWEHVVHPGGAEHEGVREGRRMMTELEDSRL